MTVAVRTDQWPPRCGRWQGGGHAGTDAPVAGDRAGPRGASRAEAARSTGMDRQTLRDWVHRFNAEGPGALVDRKAPGRRRQLGLGAAWRSWRASRPAPSHAGRRGPLASGRSLRLVERRSGIRYQSAAWAAAAARSASPGSRRGRSTPSPTPRGKPSSKNLPELIAAPLARKRGQAAGDLVSRRGRIGQKGDLTRQWARRGSRPHQPRDQRYSGRLHLRRGLQPAAGRRPRRPTSTRRP